MSLNLEKYSWWLFVYLLSKAVLLSSCDSTQSEDEEVIVDSGFEQGQSSTVVTGANLSLVATVCLYGREEDSDFQSLNCKLLLSPSEDGAYGLALSADDFLVVTAVDGVQIAWGVPSDLGFICKNVRQSTELFCFRESSEESEDFSVLLTVVDSNDSTISTQVSSTAVSESVDQTSPPDVPLALSATAVSSTQINLNYVDDSENETSFYLQRSTNEVNWTMLAITSSNVENYFNSGLTPSTEYFYRVRACNSAGCSAVSNTASATTASAGALN
jgi:hypothetical protein